MLVKNRLFTPGPAAMLPSAQMAMAAAGMHHRTAEFKALFSKTLADLKEFIGTKNDVLILSSTGTGAMESAVTNLTSPGDVVLVLTAGKFGERWTSIAKTYGCKPEVVSKPYGQTFDLAEVREALKKNPKCVYMQANETSTGARHDVQGVAAVVKEANAAGGDTLLIVDAITGLGTTHFDVDGWGVDVIIGGSQKALMIPPGLAYLAVSEAAWKRMDVATTPRFYFDLRKERKSQSKGETAYTAATALVAGMSNALDFVRDMGKGDLRAGTVKLIDSAELCAAMTRAAATALGLKLFAGGNPGAAATAIVAPEGVDSGAMVKLLREQFGMIVANGQGDEMKGKLIRVAHLGYYDFLDTIGLAAALEQVVAKVTGQPLQAGVAVKAAQEVYAAAQVTQAAEAPQKAGA